MVFGYRVSVQQKLYFKILVTKENESFKTTLQKYFKNHTGIIERLARTQSKLQNITDWAKLKKT